MITREQVADLQPGDVVELSGHPMLKGATLRGALYGDVAGALSVGDYIVRYADGRPNHTYANRMTVVLVSRAPRPLYVNHPRTEPVPGDVVRDGDGTVWLLDRWGTWQSPDSECRDEHADVGVPTPRRLLVDGETGQVVP